MIFLTRTVLVRELPQSELGSLIHKIVSNKYNKAPREQECSSVFVKYINAWQSPSLFEAEAGVRPYAVATTSPPLLGLSPGF